MKRAAWPPVPNFCLAAKIFRAENDSPNRFLNALNPSLPLRGAASWSQTTRATNCATPGYKTNETSRLAAGSALRKHKTFLMPVYYTTHAGVCQMDFKKIRKNSKKLQ